MKIFNFLVLCKICGILGQSVLSKNETTIYQIIAELVVRNVKSNGWNNILFVGEFEDILFTELKNLPVTFTVMDSETKTNVTSTSIPYPSNTIILHCKNLKHFKRLIQKLMQCAYWNPHANLLLYYNTYNEHVTAKLFYILWYYKIINAIIIHRNKDISYYAPYANENFHLKNSFYCWLDGTRTIDIGNSIICNESCRNITGDLQHPDKFGTCISYDTIDDDDEMMHKLPLFIDKTKNMHKFALRSYGTDMHPFFNQREGCIWKTLAEIMNFTINLQTSVDNINEIEYLELNKYSQRKLDLFLPPVYQVDIGIEVDYTFPYVQSGLCFISHKSETKKILLGSFFVENNYNIVIEFFCVFFFMWLVFFLYNSEQIGKFSYDQAGKDLMNAFRMFYAVGVPKIPKRKSFLIFFVIALWGLVLITFINQTFFFYIFSTTKRGKDIDTFEDVYENIQTGKFIEGMVSPDASIVTMDGEIGRLYPQLKPKYSFECVNLLKNDSNRICLIDCSLGRYLERSEINDAGEQYLHVAKEQIHSFYLNVVLPKDSPMTEHFNRHIIALVESGIVGKWTKRNDIVRESEKLYKVITLRDLEGIFGIFILYTIINIIVFTLEVVFGRKKHDSYQI